MGRSGGGGGGGARGGKFGGKRRGGAKGRAKGKGPGKGKGAAGKAKAAGKSRTAKERQSRLKGGGDGGGGGGATTIVLDAGIDSTDMAGSSGSESTASSLGPKPVPNTGSFGVMCHDLMIVTLLSVLYMFL